MRRSLSAIAATLVVGTASAQELAPGVARVQGRKLGPVIVRPELDVGILATIYKGGTTTTGAAGIASLLVGAAVSDEIVLGVHGMYAASPNPTISSGGYTATADGLTIGFWGVGLEATHHSANGFYFGGALLATQLNATYSGLSGNSKVGMGAKGLLGYDWWSASRVGFGVVVNGFTSVNGGQDGSTLTTLGVGFGLSLAVN